MVHMNKRSGIESKKRILSAALKVFSRHGYADASIREIAKASGLSIGGVYLYFKNKEELYLSLIKERISEKNRRAEKIVGSEGPPAEKLSALIEMHLDHAMKNKGLILIHIKEHAFSFGSDIRKEYFQRQISTIADIIKEGINIGEFRKCDVRETAKLIMSAIRGIVLSMAIEDEKFITAKGLNRLLMHGLLKNNY
ncbi:MAG: hypothetical protein A2X59_00995, partial [Nitrospirae bacterium GWC2_42_7]